MGTYYIDITSGVILGDGTESTPYNYEQMVNFLDSDKSLDGITTPIHLLDGDIIKIRGQRRNDFIYIIEIGPVFFSLSPSFIGSVYIEGWDVDSNGSPIFFSDHRTTYIFDDNGASGLINFKDIIFSAESRLYGLLYTANSTFFKDCLLIARDIGIRGDNISLYGCTLSCDTFTGVSVRFLRIYDTVFDVDVVSISYIDVFISTFNYTNCTNDNFTISNINDSSQYTPPIYLDTILSLPSLGSSFDAFRGFYGDYNKMYYANFGVPTITNVATFRINNGYNNGLFDYERKAPGAYSMFQDPDYNFSTYPTSGHVGSFYFGGDYDNADVVVSMADIEISPVDGVMGSGESNISKYSEIVIEAMNSASAVGQDNFPFDFSGTPRVGGSPLTVDFHAYNYDPTGPYQGYKPYEFRWWFDYNINSGADDYVSCATDRAVHTYCGGYLQEFDVRLCIMYNAI